MELLVKSFFPLNLKDNEIYCLSDFNINLLQNGNYISNTKGMAACQGPVHTLINEYQEFCQIFVKYFFSLNLTYTCNIQHLFSN